MKNKDKLPGTKEKYVKRKSNKMYTKLGEALRLKLEVITII